MKLKFIKTFTAFMMLTLILVGCRGKTQSIDLKDQGTNEKVKVFASIYPIYDFARQIGGDQAEIKIIVPDGTDPHSYEPSPRIIAELEQSNLFIYNGLGMEPWADRMLEILKGREIVIVKASESVDVISYKEEQNHHDHDKHHHHEGEYDPHIWLDPIRVIQICERILEAFIEIDPVHTETYRENFHRFKMQLEQLDKNFQEGLKEAQNRKIMVSHSAFGYLAQRYGLEEISVAGISPHGEPTPARMAELVGMARKHNINHIFFEVLANPKTAEIIAQEAGLEVMMLYNIEGLTQEQREAGENYISLMYKNLEALKKVLVK